MPFALIALGLLLVITGAQNTYVQFGSMVAADFKNAGTCNPLQKQYQGCGFTWWIAAIMLLGALGYVDSFKNFSRAFMALVIIAMLLANGGFFQKFAEALQAGPECPSGATNNADTVKKAEANAPVANVQTAANLALEVVPLVL